MQLADRGDGTHANLAEVAGKIQPLVTVGDGIDAALHVGHGWRRNDAVRRKYKATLLALRDLAIIALSGVVLEIQTEDRLQAATRILADPESDEAGHAGKSR